MSNPFKAVVSLGSHTNIEIKSDKNMLRIRKLDDIYEKHTFINRP